MYKFNFRKMTGFGFLILFGLSCMLFPCEGQVYPPSNQSMIVVLPGSTARLKWSFKNNSQATLIWHFIKRGALREEAVAVKIGTHDLIIPSSSLPGVAIETPATLVLKNVNERYNGKYRFTVQVSGGVDSAEVEVFILEKPNVKVSNCSSPITVNEGDNVTCKCTEQGGNPAANVTWYKDGDQINNTSYEENILILTNVNETHNGIYMCKAQSYNLTDEEAIEVNVRLNFKPKNTKFTFTKNPAVVNGNVAVKCESSGLPEPSYTIIHNDNKVVRKKSTYIIDDVKDIDAGTYKCIATNKLGNDTASRSLTVGKIYLPPGGNSLTFLKEPTVKIKWSLDPVLSTNISRSWSFKSRASGKDETLGEVSRAGDITIVTRLYEVDIEKPATLVLKNVDERYNGEYKFTLYPGLPGPSISEVVVFIAEKPGVVINCPSRITLDEGEDRTCVCTEQGGNPPANLTWYKDDQQIDKATYGENRLTLTSVTKQDIGTYKCVAQSYNLTDEESIEVNVILNFKPENTKIVIEQQGKVGKPVTVTCNSEGRPEPSYRITRDGTVVTTGKMYTIFEATLSGGGTYTCIAWNKLGNDSASAYLAVTGNTCDNTDDGTTVVVWHMVVSLVSGIIIGILLSYIVSCSRRKFRSGKPQSNPEPKTTEVDTTYQELNLSQLNTEDNYQSLRLNDTSYDAANGAGNDDDSTYTELSKTRDMENNYQSLT